MFKIRKPLKWCVITQGFGKNYVDFYQKLGMRGHNAYDMKAYHDPIYACFDGTIKYAGKYSDGGIGIELVSDYKDNKGYFKAIYYHLKSVNKGIKKGERVIGGQPIGITDNTGKYTTGDHLHFGMKRCDKLGNTLNWNNGYKGGIDPKKYLAKDFFDLPADKRYGSAKSPLADTLIKVEYPFLNRQKLNAIVYGGWAYSEVTNDSLYPLWVFLKKEEVRSGKKPPLRLSI